ncbi:MAG TPA: EVE domain-containing protein [Ignavibacteriaceae bacterium]|nr:EVE domain-containing protein [Ignavibacteriaceae bacterium]
MNNYWLVKSEPEEFSFEDLIKSKNKTTYWDGVRNYQARNFLRDEMKKGDLVLFYHSNSDPLAVMGVCEVVKEGYPDHTQFDPDNDHYDPKAAHENPTWIMVDIKFKQEFNNPVKLDAIKSNPKLKNMKLIARGNRLSVMPVSKEEFDEIVKMGSPSLALL